MKKRFLPLSILMLSAVCCTAIGFAACVGSGDDDRPPADDSSIPSHTHSYTPTVTPPTCTSAGYTTYTCACGNFYIDSYVSAKAHTPATAVTENEVAATCTSAGGFDEVVYCVDCEEELSRVHRTTEKTAHTPATAVTENEVAATCTTAGGFDEVVYCEDCEEELSRVHNTIPAHGHSFTDGVCADCGELESAGLEFTELDDGTYSVSKGTADVTNVVIPSVYNGVSVTAIAANAFASSDVECITIPDSVVNFGINAFYQCNALTKVVYKGDLEQWLSVGFDEKNSNPVSYSGNLYFGEELLTELNIPDGVTTVNAHAFAKCLSITYIDIPASVTVIDEYAFRGCANVESITVDDGNAAYKSVGNCLIDTQNKYLVLGCKNSIIPDDGSVTTVGRAFVDCAVTSITIPETITVIGEDAFRGSKLTSVVIPASVIEIGAYAFSGCADLESITFETSDGWAFFGAESGYMIREATADELGSADVFVTSFLRVYTLKRNQNSADSAD